MQANLPLAAAFSRALDLDRGATAHGGASFAVGVVRPRSLFEALSGGDPFQSATALCPQSSLDGIEGARLQDLAYSPNEEEDGENLMQFSSPSKKQRPSNAELDPTEQHQRCGGAQPPPRELFHKRKWDDVDEDGEEEERDAIEEEELLDSSDDEEEEGLHRSRHHRQQQQTLLDGRRVANERMTRPKADLQSATEENGDKGEAVVLVSFPAETGSASHEAKHHKTVQKKPDIRDIPRARHVLLCFPEAGDVMVRKMLGFLQQS